MKYNQGELNHIGPDLKKRVKDQLTHILDEVKEISLNDENKHYFMRIFWLLDDIQGELNKIDDLIEL